MFIPERCPGCGDKNAWQEVINPFTTGIPVFNGKARIVLGWIHGNNSSNYKCRCEKCGYEGIYDDKTETIDLKRSRFR